MPRFTFIAYEWPGLPEWRQIGFFIRHPPPCLSEIEQEEEHCLEAMLHWHDPGERLRNGHRRCHTHTLVDDNPSSG
jgi:hypothetical protein